MFTEAKSSLLRRGAPNQMSFRGFFIKLQIRTSACDQLSTLRVTREAENRLAELFAMLQLIY